MKYLSKFQRSVIDELIKQPKSEGVDLGVILLKFLPANLHLGKGFAGKISATYSTVQHKFIRSEISLKVLEFITLVKELTANNYLIRVEPETNRDKVSIGEIVNQPQYASMRLATDISEPDLESVFLKNDYLIITEYLSHLKKHNYKQDEDYRADRRLLYLGFTAFCAFLSALASLITILIIRC